MKRIKYARSLLKKLFFSLVLLNRSEHSPFEGKKKVLIRKSFLFMEGFGDPSWDNCQSFFFFRRALIFRICLLLPCQSKARYKRLLVHGMLPFLCTAELILIFVFLILAMSTNLVAFEFICGCNLKLPPFTYRSTLPPGNIA